MRRTREATEESRQAIVASAAKLFRERGFDGVGVADIMAAAGMTHGGFYRHFASKEALAAEAVARVLAEKAEAAATDATRYLGEYLSRAHVAQPGRGCPIAALGAEAWRAGPELRSAFSQGIGALVEALARARGVGGQPARQEALALLASMVGAIVLARASSSGAFQHEVLAAVDRLHALFTAQAVEAGKRRPRSSGGRTDGTRPP